jgi:hypothetical protein
MIHLRTAIALLLVLLAAACDTGRDPETIYVFLDALPMSGVTDGGDGWETNGWDEAWLRYPGRSTLVLEHALGFVPAEVTVYLSFEEDGSAAALATGDTARIIDVDDAFVTIRNDTHADFFARIVLR